MSNITNIVKKSLPKELKTDSSASRQSLQTCVSSWSPVQLGSTEDLQTWLQQAFPVSPSQSQENSREKMILGTCGLPLSQSFAQYDQDSRSWRTSQACLLTNTFEQYSGTWPKAGIYSNGAVYRLESLGRNIQETGYGYLPTPTKHNSKEGAYPSEYNRNTPTLATHAGGKINPEWTEWLMGWPIGWTDLRPLEMGKYQEWLQKHGDS